LKHIPDEPGDLTMKRSVTARSLFAVLIALAATSLTSVAFAQDSSTAKPMYWRTPQHYNYILPPSTTHLQSWKGGFKDLTGVNRHFVMVGTDPNATNVTTTIPVLIIPIKMVYGPSNGNKTFDPLKHKLPNGKTVMQMILASPLFNASVDFVQGGTDLGKTQYIDAFQRGNFWGKNVKKNSSYHVLLGKPTILPEQTIKVSPSLGQVITNPISGRGLVGTFDLNTLQPILEQTYIPKLKQIQPDVFPIFVTYDVYGTVGGVSGCCYGGYHFTLGGPPNSQTYSWSTTIDQGTNNFAQDVSAMSHEIGEWYDNPFFGANQVGCQDNSQLEVGDPLENGPNFGAFPYKVGGFTYNLQSLVFLGYFGAPTSTSVHKWLSFQNDKHNVCPGQ
jgi:hypothetical protein